APVCGAVIEKCQAARVVSVAEDPVGTWITAGDRYAPSAVGPQRVDSDGRVSGQRVVDRPGNELVDVHHPDAHIRRELALEAHRGFHRVRRLQVSIKELL